jgi:hypothetical protein
LESRDFSKCWLTSVTGTSCTLEFTPLAASCSVSFCGR